MVFTISGANNSNSQVTLPYLQTYKMQIKPNSKTVKQNLK